MFSINISIQDNQLNLSFEEVEIKMYRATRDEKLRLAKLRERNSVLESIDKTSSELVLDYDSVTKKKLMVHPSLVDLLKFHQKEAVQFMYDCCFTSLDGYRKEGGSGAVL